MDFTGANVRAEASAIISRDQPAADAGGGFLALTGGDFLVLEDNVSRVVIV